MPPPTRKSLRVEEAASPSKAAPPKAGGKPRNAARKADGTDPRSLAKELELVKALLKASQLKTPSSKIAEDEEASDDDVEDFEINDDDVVPEVEAKKKPRAVKMTARMSTAGSKIAGDRVNKIKRKLGTEDEEALFAQWKAGLLKTQAVPAEPVVVIPTVEDDDCIARNAKFVFSLDSNIFFPRRLEFTKLSLTILIKYGYLDDSQVLRLLLDLGIPKAQVTRQLRIRLTGRMRTRRCGRFTQLRLIIAEATGVTALDPSSATEWSLLWRNNWVAVRAACQAKCPWDHVLEPHDIPFLASDDDPFGSEIFINLITLWQERMLPSLKKEIKISDVPPIEELTLMLRMVCFFVLFVSVF